ncbi:hypothetical protein [Hymenobacter radiodurans]|uniref:hypothetical protein n=1 Tax=Hymenobacter radiodurans TaxID=2496028 RepID=UPI001058C6BE|nr:hypothetical protein [Hymenobacter radiodurans]
MALRRAAFLNTIAGNPQRGVIATADQAQAGPKINGLPAAGYEPMSFTNTTTSIQYVWFEFVQQGEFTSTGAYNPAFLDHQRFSVYDFWDFTVKDNAGTEKPGRLFSKQWAFSAGQGDGRFASTFNMYPLIPSPTEANRFFVKKFELAGIAPQNFFRFVSNSTGANPAQVTPNTFLSTTKSQTTEIDYPEYLNFVNNPDPEIWPSAQDPDLKVVSVGSYCKNGGGVMEFFLRSSLGAR